MHHGIGTGRDEGHVGAHLVQHLGVLVAVPGSRLDAFLGHGGLALAVKAPAVDEAGLVAAQLLARDDVVVDVDDHGLSPVGLKSGVAGKTLFGVTQVFAHGSWGVL